MQVLYRVDSMRPFAAIFTSVTTAVLNLIVILIMSYVSNLKNAWLAALNICISH